MVIFVLKMSAIDVQFIASGASYRNALKNAVEHGFDFGHNRNLENVAEV